MNDYFSCIGEKLAQTLKPCGQFDFQKYCKYTCKSMFCAPVTSDEITKIISNLPNNKAPRIDNISANC